MAQRAAANAFWGGPLLRLGFVCALLLGSSLVLIWRLYSLQVRETAQFQRLADQERRAEIPIPPRRGALLDSAGNPLAVSVLYDSVYALGPLLGDLDRTAEALAPILEVPAPEIRARLSKKNQVPVVLRSGVHSAVGEKVRTLNLPGVYLEQEPVRRYPEGSIAAQILGFVGQDFKGLGGLELSYDEELGGTPGIIDTEKDTTGQEITLGRRLVTPPRQGSDLVLTIDRYVQRVSERLLADAVRENKAKGGVVLVMDPKTGGVLAAASLPTYSLTDDVLYRPEQAQLYKSTIVTDQYEPGSTMKLITMAAAIEEGLVSPGTTFNDTGWANVAGSVIRNWDGAGNGTITMTQLLTKSSNVGAQWVAGLLGPERFYAHVDEFGFGKRTGVRLPGEIRGTVRTPQDEGWSRVDLATNSYGQGLAVTPLQLLAATSSFANDGVMLRPRMVQEIRGENARSTVEPERLERVVSARTARTILQMMVEVADQEALRDYRIPGFKLGLKTGTADTPTGTGYDLDRTYASVVAFLPAEKPRFAVLVRLDAPEAMYGGRTAVPVLRDLAQALIYYYGIPPTEPQVPKRAAPASPGR